MSPNGNGVALVRCGRGSLKRTCSMSRDALPVIFILPVMQYIYIYQYIMIGRKSNLYVSVQYIQYIRNHTYYFQHSTKVRKAMHYNILT